MVHSGWLLMSERAVQLCENEQIFCFPFQPESDFCLATCQALFLDPHQTTLCSGEKFWHGSSSCLPWPGQVSMSGFFVEGSISTNSAAGHSQTA